MLTERDSDGRGHQRGRIVDPVADEQRLRPLSLLSHNPNLLFGRRFSVVGVLQLARTYGTAALQRTVEAALRLGCTDHAAVRHLLLTATLERPPRDPMPIGAALAHYDRPLPSVAAYDTLLSQEAAR